MRAVKTNMVREQLELANYRYLRENQWGSMMLWHNLTWIEVVWQRESICAEREREQVVPLWEGMHKPRCQTWKGCISHWRIHVMERVREGRVIRERMV